MTQPPMAPVSGAALRTLATKKIFFGHQSVGYNIVEGVADVLKAHPDVPLQIIEDAAANGLTRAGLVHSKIGENGNPELKIRDFAARVRSGVGGTADVALFKFCYADIERDSDPRAVFTAYKETMDALAREYPNTRFVHVTVPLKATLKGWKMHVKNLLGKPDPRIEDNLRRDEYNELLRREYAGRGIVFDLAAIEATGADGALSCDRKDGRAVPCLTSEYTYDSGHLNERGRRLVAERFLGSLARL